MLLKSYNFTVFTLFVLFLSFLYFEEIQHIKLILYFKDIIFGLNILVILITLFFNKSKLFLFFIITIFFNIYMFYPSLIGLEGGNNAFWYIYPITLSLGFLLISLLKERGLFNLYGLLKFTVIILLILFSYYLLKFFTIDLKNSLDNRIFWFNLPKNIKTYQLGFLLLTLTLLFNFLSSFVIYKTKTEYASFWMFLFLISPIFFTHTRSAFLLSLLFVSGIVLYALLKETYDMAYMDTLTQLPSRRALEEEFLRLGKKYTIAMVDIDFFKKFNDTYGHDTGDEVLKLVASGLSSIKGKGKAYRYGGEEFVIVFNNKNLSDTLPYLEEIRQNIYQRGFVIREKNRPKEKPRKKIKNQNQKKVKLSVSIGVASSPKDATKPYDVLKTADNMLYKAKESGRNCVVST